MRDYRITKYNPKNRTDDIYTIREWTSINDIGKTFDDGVLSYAQYKKVEQAYIDCCIELIQRAEIRQMYVYCPEYYNTDIRFPYFASSESDIRQIIMYCLQEKCWAKLEAENFFVHFGYDYYLYVGTNLPCVLVNEIANRHNLFCEISKSPYNRHE